jgi:hypothetical protein
MYIKSYSTLQIVLLFTKKKKRELKASPNLQELQSIDLCGPLVQTFIPKIRKP